MGKKKILGFLHLRGQNLAETICHFWQRLRLWQKIAYPLIAVSSVMVVYLIITLASVSRFELALASLRSSFVERSSCHEDCQADRTAAGDIIKQELSAGGQEKLFLRYLKEGGELPEYERELWRLAAAAYGAEHLPGYLRLFLLEEAAPASAKAAVRSFNLAVGERQLLADKLWMELEAASESAVAEESLAAIGITGDGRYLSRYLEIITGRYPDALKIEAAKNIAAIKEKKDFFAIEQIGLLEEWLLSPDCSSDLRRELTMLIGDYYLVFPEEAAASWRRVYESEDLDAISRSFAADSLNHLLKEKNELPTVSDEEWADYYNR